MDEEPTAVVVDRATDAFLTAGKFAHTAADYMSRGDIERAKLYAQLADVQSRLALAAAVALTGDSERASGFRRFVSGSAYL